MRGDLVIVALGGVQRLLTESRTTADVAGGSEIMQRLSRRAARVVREAVGPENPNSGLVFPALDGDSGAVSNKVVFLAGEGQGPTVARLVASEVRAQWAEFVGRAFSDPIPPTPGVPDLSWVSVTGACDESAYPALWARAQAAFAGRRRARVFTPIMDTRMALCSVAPHLPASRAPSWARPHERNELLSAAGWVRRKMMRSEVGFPSTATISARTFLGALNGSNIFDDALRELAGQVSQLGRTVPAEPTDALGEWIYPDRWRAIGGDQHYRSLLGSHVETVARDGRAAAARLLAAAERAGVARPTPYYAVVMQDVDRLGRALGALTVAHQRMVSKQLAEVAEDQRGIATETRFRAQPVYAGGDDFLAFCPASTALSLADRLRRLIDERLVGGPLGSSVTASSAVVFAHMSAPLQEVVAAARDALHDAKSATGAGGRNRDAVAVIALRRGGERARTIQPWRPVHADPGVSAVDLLTRVRPASTAGQLSAGLAATLERDQAPLAELAADSRWWPTLRDELARLVGRRGGSAEAAGALWTLGMNERSGPDPVFRAGPSALVARFLTQECR